MSSIGFTYSLSSRFQTSALELCARKIAGKLLVLDVKTHGWAIAKSGDARKALNYCQVALRAAQAKGEEMVR